MDLPWSNPAFLDLTAASLGVQLGAKSSDIAFFMLTSEAENALKKGTIALGADATAVAGNYDTNWNAGTASVVAYELSSGGMLGISLNGTSMTKNDGMNSRYYGRSVDYVSLLENRAGVSSDKNIDSFISALPGYSMISRKTAEDL